MIRNQKGFTGLEIGGILAIGFLAITVIAPIFGIKVPGLSGSGGQTSTQRQIQTTRMIPYVNPQSGENVRVMNKDGSTTLLMQQDTSNQTMDELIIPKAPLVERVVLWFVHLGFLGLILALLFPTVAVTIWVWLRGRFKALKEQLSQHKEDTKTIVKSVDKGLDVFDAAIKASLAAYETAKSAAAETTDPQAMAANQGVMNTQQTIAGVITKMKQDFLDALSKVQGENSSAEALVTKAQQGTL